MAGATVQPHPPWTAGVSRLRGVAKRSNKGIKSCFSRWEDDNHTGKRLQRKSQIALNRIKKSDLVIIDDLMYMAMDPAEANQFFQLVDYLYERSSIILTSNKSPDQWGELLGDEGVATAILDRLLHRVELVQMDDESYRMKHRQRVFD